MRSRRALLPDDACISVADISFESDLAVPIRPRLAALGAQLDQEISSSSETGLSDPIRPYVSSMQYTARPMDIQPKLLRTLVSMDRTHEIRALDADPVLSRVGDAVAIVEPRANCLACLTNLQVGADQTFCRSGHNSHIPHPERTLADAQGGSLQ